VKQFTATLAGELSQLPNARVYALMGDVAVAAVWLVFYVLAIALAISSPVISRAIEFAAR